MTAPPGSWPSSAPAVFRTAACGRWPRRTTGPGCARTPPAPSARSDRAGARSGRCARPCASVPRSPASCSSSRRTGSGRTAASSNSPAIWASPWPAPCAGCSRPRRPVGASRNCAGPASAANSPCRPRTRACGTGTSGPATCTPVPTIGSCSTTAGRIPPRAAGPSTRKTASGCWPCSPTTWRAAATSTASSTGWPTRAAAGAGTWTTAGWWSGMRPACRCA